VATPLGGAARAWLAPPGGVGPWLLLLLSPSGYFRHTMKYEFLGIFLELLIFRNMCLDGPFSSRILTPAAISPIIIKHAKTEETT
jgi:hypothetical protein